MAPLPEAYYHFENGLYRPTPLTIGPWDVGLQHGGPPSALLARAIERFGGEDFQVARLTVDLLRPIAMDPVRVTVSPIRQGKMAQWLEATLAANGRTLARATAVLIGRAELSLQERNASPAPPPLSPEQGQSFQFPFFQAEIGYHRSVELRFVMGAWAKGPATVWMRTLQPLVAGEAASGLQRLMVLADASNGIAPALPLHRYTFVNPDMTVYISRLPASEWIALSARSVPEPNGVGLVQSQLFDADGEIGRSAQSLVIRERNL